MSDPRALFRPRKRISPRRRHPINLRRRRRHARRPDAELAIAALHALKTIGEIIEREGHRYLVCGPLDDDLMEQLLVAQGASEDIEDNGDRESSTGNDEDREGDDLEEHDEPALGWGTDLDQRQLHASDHDAEASLGWSPWNNGPQVALSEGVCEDLEEGVDDVPHDENYAAY